MGIVVPRPRFCQLLFLWHALLGSQNTVGAAGSVSAANIISLSVAFGSAIDLLHPNSCCAQLL